MTAPHLHRIVYREWKRERLEHCYQRVRDARAELEAARGTKDERRCARKLGRRMRVLAKVKGTE